MKRSGSLLPRPACGERVGVRGTLNTLGLADSPPHPDFSLRVKSDLSPQAGRGDPSTHADLTQSHHALVRSIFRRQAMRPLVIEHAAKITAINPSAARLALEEMFGLVLVGVSILGNIFSARNLHSSLFNFCFHQCFSFDKSYSGIGFAPCRAGCSRRTRGDARAFACWPAARAYREAADSGSSRACRIEARSKRPCTNFRLRSIPGYCA